MNSDNQSDKKDVALPSGGNSAPILKLPEVPAYYKKDKNFIFAHQKIEKLVAALYMITNFFPAEEPSKWSLRKLGTSLLHTNIDLKDDKSENSEIKEIRIREIVLEIMSLLEVASFAGLISSMNLGVLRGEFNNLISHIHNTLKEKDRNDLRIEPGFFESKVIESVEGKEHNVLPNMNRFGTGDFSNSIKDKTNVLYKAGEVGNDNGQDRLQKLREFSPVAVKKNKRQSIIIALLRRKKEIMIRDVSLIIRDCSEKTIQRELLSLVEQGVLKKEGDRRWTKYTLA